MDKKKFKIIGFLFVLSIICLILTINKTNITGFPPDPFFFVKSLPFVFWLGKLSIIALFFYVFLLPGSMFKITAEIFFLVLTIFYVHGIIAVVYPAPHPHDAYVFTNVVNWIDTNGYLAGSQNSYLSVYPLATVMFSMSNQLIGTEVIQFAAFYPMVSAFLVCFTIYTGAKMYSGQYALIAPFVYLTFNWYNQWHMCPQNYAIITSASIILLLLILFSFKNNRDKNPQLFLLLILLSIVTVLAHVATPLILILGLIGIFLLFWIFSLKRFRQTRNSFRFGSEYKGKLLTIFTFLFILFLGYAFYQADFVTTRMIRWSYDIFENLLYGDLLLTEARGVTNPLPEYVFSNYIRIIFTFITSLLISLVAFVIFLKKTTMDATITCIGLMGGYFLLSLVLVVTAFNTYGYSKGIIFGLIPGSIIITIFIKNVFTEKTNIRLFDKSLVVLVFIIVCISVILVPAMKNSIDAYNYVSLQDIKANQFEEERLVPNKALIFQQRRYNLRELKDQSGQEYIESFYMLNNIMVYNNGNSMISYSLSH